MKKEELQKEVGKNLQQARSGQNMTREQLAEKAEISPQFLANLECGNKMMSLPTLCKLADSLCISIDTLVYGYNTNTRLRNIERLLLNQSEEIVQYIEELILFTISHVPVCTDNGVRQEVAQKDELAV